MLGALVDRLLFGLLRRTPGRLVAAVALIFYPGVGLALPLGLHSSLTAFVELNVGGATYAALVAFGWLVLQIEARDRRHLVEWTTSLRLLSANEFESLVGELWRREGWTVVETGRQGTPDGNVDLTLTRDGVRRIVQCKRWTSRDVGVEDIRTFAGTLLRLGLPGNAGVFVTLSSFGEKARTEAEEMGITLVNGRDLYTRVEQVRKPETCALCGAPMKLDRSVHGWWFRCITPGCNGKRDLGNEPGRVVELLTRAA